METGAALEIMEIAGELLEKVHRLVWGPGLLILMLGTGILYTGKSRGFQIFGWKVWWRPEFGFSDGMYGTGSYHWNRKYRGSGNSFESRWSWSCFLDVDLSAFGNDDRICGGVAGNPLPLPE